MKCVYNCKTPIISAVGHETDDVLSDFSADVRASTPSNAAELAVPDKEDIIRGLDSVMSKLNMRMSAILGNYNKDVELLCTRLTAASPENMLKINSEQLKTAENDLRIKYSVKLEAFSRLIESHEGNIKNKYQAKLNASLGKLDLYRKSIEDKYSMRLNNFETAFMKCTVAIENLSPMKTLSRGFSVVYKDGRVMDSAEKLSVGDTAEIQFADGKVSAEIIGKEVN